METLAKAVDALVSEPIKVEVDIHPQSLWEKSLQRLRILPKTKVFVIRPITLGNLARISKLLLSIDISPDQLRDQGISLVYELMSEHSETVSRIVAVAIDNRKEGPSEKLVQFILHQFTAAEIMSVFSIVVKQMDMKSFMNTIISVRGVNVLEKKSAGVPNAESSEVSPMDQGS